MSWHEIADRKQAQIMKNWGSKDCIIRFLLGHRHEIGFAMSIAPHMHEKINPNRNLLVFYLDIGIIHTDMGDANTMVNDPTPSLNPFRMNYLSEPSIRELRGWFDSSIIFHEVKQGKFRREVHPVSGKVFTGYETQYIERVK